MFDIGDKVCNVDDVTVDGMVFQKGTVLYVDDIEIGGNEEGDVLVCHSTEHPLIDDVVFRLRFHEVTNAAKYYEEAWNIAFEEAQHREKVRDEVMNTLNEGISRAYQNADEVKKKWLGLC